MRWQWWTTSSQEGRETWSTGSAMKTLSSLTTMWSSLCILRVSQSNCSRCSRLELRAWRTKIILFLVVFMVSKSYTARHLLGYYHGLTLVVVLLLGVWRLSLQITLDFAVITDRIRLLPIRQHCFGMPIFCTCVYYCCELEMWVGSSEDILILVYQAQIKKRSTPDWKPIQQFGITQADLIFKKEVLSSSTTSARNGKSFNQVGSNPICSLFDHGRVHLGSKS